MEPSQSPNMDSSKVSIKSEAGSPSASPSPPRSPLPVAVVNRAVGRMVDSSQADDRNMIHLVRDRPLLYARSNLPVASYQAKVKKLWREVASIMGWTVAEVRRKWSHIRNSYSRHLRNEMHGVRTGRGRIVSRWYLADELEFLREHMATDTRLPPDSSPTLLAAPWFNPSPHFLAPSEESNTADDDVPYFQFFRGIYPDYQELDSRQQRQFRRQCMVYLHQMVDGAPSPSPSPHPSDPSSPGS